MHLLFVGHFVFILMCLLAAGQAKGGGENSDNEEIMEDMVTEDIDGLSSSASSSSSHLTKEPIDPSPIVSPIAGEDNSHIETEKKVPSGRVECFADYLVLAKGAKTEIYFAEKVRFPPNSWRMKRAVVRQPDVEQWKVYKREIAEAKGFGKRFADKCFARNREVVLFNRIDESGKDSNSKVEEAFVKISDLFDHLNSNGRLQVSDGMNKKLEKQSDCLARFLTKNFGIEHIQWEAIDGNTAEEIAILKANKAKWRWNTEMVRWKWAAGEAANGQQEMPEIRYERGTLHYNELKKCFNILLVKNGIHRDAISGRTFIRLKPLLERFRSDQMFVGKIRKENKDFKVSVLKGNDDDECSICLDKIRVGKKMQQMYPCNHIFDKKCIEGWLKANDSCPMCRERVVKPPVPALRLGILIKK